MRNESKTRRKDANPSFLNQACHRHRGNQQSKQPKTSNPVDKRYRNSQQRREIKGKRSKPTSRKKLKNKKITNIAMKEQNSTSATSPSSPKRRRNPFHQRNPMLQSAVHTQIHHHLIKSLYLFFTKKETRNKERKNKKAHEIFPQKTRTGNNGIL